MLGWEYPPHIQGGLGTACRGLASALARRGADVTFLLPWVHGDEPRGGVRLVSAQLDETPPAYGPLGCDEGDGAARRRGYARDMVRAARSLVAPAIGEARRRAFDVVHAHDWMTYPAGIAAARAARRPLVVHVHSCEFDRSAPAPNPDIVAIEQRGFDEADRIVCVSRYAAEVVASRYRVDAAKVRVLHNAGPHLRPVRPRRADRRIPEPVVLFLGRVTWQKGPSLFLEAAARVAALRDDARFVVAGDGDLLHATIERAAALGIGHRTHFTGFLDRAGVARAFRDADVYVMPSLSEPFGIAPLEAAAHGVAVLVSERSGVAEVLPSAPRFAPDDPVELAREILRVLRSAPLRRRLATRARAEAGELRWERQAERLLRETYAEVVA